MEKIIVFSAPDKQNEAAKETAMQYARLSKEEADRSGGQAGRAEEEAARAKGYADRIDLGAIDTAVQSTSVDAEAALLAKQAAEQAAIDAANDANAQITPNVSAAVAAKNAAEAAKALSEAAAQAALNSNWNYIVENNAALLALTGMTANQTAFVKATEHQWKYEGGVWVDKGPSVVAGKATLVDLNGRVRPGEGEWSHRFVDQQTGAVIGGIKPDGSFVARGFKVRTEAGDEAIAVLQLSLRMKQASARKVRFTSRRQAVLSIIFDDLNPTDAAVIDMLEALGLRAGFALNTAFITTENIGLYQEAYLRGHSILSHSTNGTAMSSGAETVAAIEAKMATSKTILEGYGFKISGWVTPSSVLHSSYQDALRKHYGYAYTQTSSAGWNAMVDPTLLGRRGIESLLNSDEPTFGGHNVAAVLADMDTAVAGKQLRAYYCHGVPSAYYTNADSTPRPSVAEMQTILQYLATLRDSGQALVVAPDEAMAIYYGNPVTA